MRHKLNLLQSIGMATLMAGFLGTGAAMAQERALDRKDRIERASETRLDPAMATARCEEVTWHRDLLGKHPFVIDACHDVVIANDERWARFEVEYLGRKADRSVLADFRDADGRSLGLISLRPGENQRVMLDGQPYTWDDVYEGQILNLYVPEGQYGFATEARGTPRELARATDAEPRRDDRDRLARAEPRPFDERPRQQLPATAGPLPLLGLAGLMSLLGGLGLTMRRRLRNTSA
jgi:hypothetical protein